MKLPTIAEGLRNTALVFNRTLRSCDTAISCCMNVLFPGDEYRQLQDQESGRSVVAPRDLRELMAVLPNVDLTDTLEIPRVFRCDEQTLPCDHTSRYRSTTGWCNNLRHPEWGKSLRAFVRLLPPAYSDGKVLHNCYKIRSRRRVSDGLMLR
jgi:hypothetical protein